VCGAIEVAALVLGATAFAADAALAIYAGGSWGDAMLDAATMIPATLDSG